MLKNKIKGSAYTPIDAHRIKFEQTVHGEIFPNTLATGAGARKTEGQVHDITMPTAPNFLCEPCSCIRKLQK